MDSKEQLPLDFDGEGPQRRGSKRPFILPALCPASHRHPAASFTNFSPLRPRSADSSVPRLLPWPASSSFHPLFSTSHRITAAGNVVHLTQAELDELAAQANAGCERVVETRQPEGTAGHERIIMLEPLAVHAKVNSGLKESQLGHGLQEKLDEVERRRRRKASTAARRLKRQRQREEREQLARQQRAEENKEQTEEKIEAEHQHRAHPSSSRPSSPSSSHSPSRSRRLQDALDQHHQLTDLADSMAPSPDALHALSTINDGAQPSSASVSAAIQLHVTERMKSNADSDVQHPATEESKRMGQGRDDWHREVAGWLRKRSKRPHRGAAHHLAVLSGDELLLWNERRRVVQGDAGDDAEPQWASTARRSVIEAELSDSDTDSTHSSQDDDEEEQDSHSSASSDRSSLTDSDHDGLSTSEQRTRSTLKRIGEEADSRPSTSPASSTSSHPSTASSRPRRHKHGSDFPSATSPTGRRALRTVKTLMRMRPGARSKDAEAELLRLQQAGRRTVMFDKAPVMVNDGDSIERESVYMHHAREVQLIVDLMMAAQDASSLNVMSPISLQSIGPPGLGNADPKASVTLTGGRTAAGKGGRGKSVSVVDRSASAVGTTVMHGKDLMIVIRWLTDLARRYIHEVQGDAAYAATTAARPPPSNSQGVAAAADPSSSPARSPPLPPLDYLGLDRRLLYKQGFTHERIDQMYSGVYSYSAGFYHLLAGLVVPHLASSTLSPDAFMHKLWQAYQRLVELAHPHLYQWVLGSMKELGKEEAEQLYQQHLADCARSASVVKARREEIQKLKEEYARTSEAYEDTLDGASEARVTAMSLREQNFREERQMLEISDESIAEMTVKANRALLQQQAVYEDSARVREQRANTVRAIQQARADLHLAQLHHEDMLRLISERTAINADVEALYPPLLQRVLTIEEDAARAAATAAALTLQSFQLQCYNQQVQEVTGDQVEWIKQAAGRGLLMSIADDPWKEVEQEITAAYDEAQRSLTSHLGVDVQLEGLDVAVMEREIRRALAASEPLSAAHKSKLGVLQYEHEKDTRVAAAQALHASHTAALAALNSELSALSADQQVVHGSYSAVYEENEAIMKANADLQALIDSLLVHLDHAIQQQQSSCSSISFHQSEVASFIQQCTELPTQIEGLRAATAALVPRQAELNSVETAKGEVYRDLQQEKEKLDAEHARALRDGEELKIEMVELDQLLREMEEKAKPLWRELDGKLGVLERELDYKRREWETDQMRLCEGEQKTQGRVQALQRSVEKLRPRQAQLNEVLAETEAVRATIMAEQALHECIRLELRETREQLQGRSKEKEDFLAQHITDKHQLEENKGKALGHIAHLQDVLEHTRSELRASRAVNEQMLVGFDKRLQQWKLQLEDKREALRKKREMDGQRKDVQLVKRGELLQAIERAKTDFEVEDERRRELQETVDMMQQELAAEVAHSQAMQRENERLAQFHSELTLAAPHLQRELERVQQKDVDFDLLHIEQAVQRELVKRQELMRRVAILEEDEWHQLAHRTERWIQTEPTMYFQELSSEDVKERFLPGRELGLMTEQWMQDKQRAIRAADEEDAEQRIRVHSKAQRSLQPSPVFGAVSSSPSFESSSTSTASSTRWTTRDDGRGLLSSSSGLHPGWTGLADSQSAWFPASQSSANHSTAKSIPRRRSGSSSTLHSAQQEGGSSGIQAASDRRRAHTRTQSSLPCPVNWHPSLASEAAARGWPQVPDEFEEEKADVVDWDTPAGMPRLSQGSRRSLSQSGRASRSSSAMDGSPQFSAHPRPSRSARPASATLSRPTTADSSSALNDEDSSTASRSRAPRHMRSRSPFPHDSRPESRQRPPSATRTRSSSSSTWTGRSSSDASMDSDESSHKRSTRTSNADDTQSPLLMDWGAPPAAGTVMDVEVLIPHSAMRPPPSQRSPILPLSLAALAQQRENLSASSASSSLEELHPLTARSLNMAMEGSSTPEEDERAEQDAQAAGIAQQQHYDQSAHRAARRPGTSQHSSQRRSSVPTSATHTSSGPHIGPAISHANLAASDVSVFRPDAASSGELLLSPKRAHRGAVHLAASPMAGTLSEWLEMQVRNAMDMDEDDQGRSRQATLSQQQQQHHHQHLSLAMPDAHKMTFALPAPHVPSGSVVAPPASDDESEAAAQRELARAVISPRVPALVHLDLGDDSASPTIVSPITGTAFPREEQRGVPLAEAAKAARNKSSSSPAAKALGQRREVYDDELPGRVPYYVKRSIRSAHAIKK